MVVRIIMIEVSGINFLVKLPDFENMDLKTEEWICSNDECKYYDFRIYLTNDSIKTCVCGAELQNNIL